MNLDFFQLREQVIRRARAIGEELGISFEEPTAGDRMLLPEEARNAVLLWQPKESERWGTVDVSDAPEEGVTITFFEGTQWRKRWGVDPFTGEEGEEESWKSFREVLSSLKAFVRKQTDPVPVLSLEGDPIVFPGDRVGWALATCRIELEHPGEFRRIRTVGVMESIEQAHALLQDNHLDLYEMGYYPEAVLEPVVLGRLNAVSPRRLWYAYDGAFEGYRPVAEPEGFAGRTPLGGIGLVDEVDETRPSEPGVTPLPSRAYPADPMPAFDPGRGLGFHEEDRLEPDSLLLSVTACALDLSPDPASIFTRSHTTGLLTSMAQVHSAVQKNAGDLYQGGRFPWVLVEGVRLGAIYGVSHDRVWYRWDEEENRYRPAEEPEGLRQYVALGGIG